jgi:acyl-CoA reductase-like NAD-dependent aldehyde dehydrogenase
MTTISRDLVCRNPADEREVVATYRITAMDDVSGACERAAAAFAQWSVTPGPRRGAILHRVAGLLEERAESIAREITREEGKLLADALGETLRAAAVLRFHAGEAERIGGDAADGSDSGTLAFTRRRPLGVVALITPWNFPIAIPCWKMAPALAAGNAVVIKPSSKAPGATLALVQALADAGLPDGVVQVVIGEAEVGRRLADDPHVRALSFTGSNAVGEKLRERVAPRGVRFQAELGGNNPLIVLADADPAFAASLAVSGAFGAAGQKCTATRRVVIEVSAFERVAEAIRKRAAALRTGPGLQEGVEIPPLIDRGAQEGVVAAIDQARTAGAEVVLDGTDVVGERPHGCFVAPTLLTGVAPGMAVVDDEVFGPVCSLIPAADFDEAIAQANATPYGLSASLCTTDLARAFEFADRIEAGMVHINRPTPGADPHMPFGGIKASSGSGYREQGHAAMEFFTQGQTIYLQPGGGR